MIAKDSPTAILLYVISSALVIGAILGYLLVVPILRNSCVWFNGRCVPVTVVLGPDNTLLVTYGINVYFFDGTNIYAYGDSVQGTCPGQIATGLSQTPVPAPPVSNFCYKWQPNTNPDEPSVCVDMGTSCKTIAQAVTVGEISGYRCGSTGPITTAPTCCESVPTPPCTRLSQPVVSNSELKDNANPKYSCGEGTTETAEPICCEHATPSPTCPPTESTESTPSRFQQCVESPTRQTPDCSDAGINADKCCTFACDDPTIKLPCCKFMCGSEVVDADKCCTCSPDFNIATYPGTVQAYDIYQPVFAVDAATLTLKSKDPVCALRSNLVTQQFAATSLSRINMNIHIPVQSAALNVYQIFNVLEKKGIFKRPTKIKTL